jgi:hypothetical protein
LSPEEVASEILYALTEAGVAYGAGKRDELVKIIASHVNSFSRVSRDQYPDSVEKGTPAKGGAVKVYFDASSKEETELRIKNAVEALNFLRERLDGTEKPPVSD